MPMQAQDWLCCSRINLHGPFDNRYLGDLGPMIGESCGLMCSDHHHVYWKHHSAVSSLALPPPLKAQGVIQLCKSLALCLRRCS